MGFPFALWFVNLKIQHKTSVCIILVLLLYTVNISFQYLPTLTTRSTINTNVTCQLYLLIETAYV